jgi:hypothetical protein
LLLPYPGNQLFIKLKGKESVHLAVQQARNYAIMENGIEVQKTDWYEELFEEKHHIINMTVPLYTWGTLIPGQYIVPFSFMIPSALPSSFYQEGHRYLANINYHIEAILQPFMLNEPRLKYKQNFIVRQPLTNVGNGHGQTITTQLSACCSSKGSNVLKVNFEKNYYAPGETAQVIMQLDNTQSQIANSRIAFTLNQKLTLRAGAQSQVKNHIKVERDLPGVPAGGASTSNLIALNLPAFQGGDYKKTRSYVLTEYLVNLKEDNNVLNSCTKSQFITSEYCLSVSCPMEGCCANTPAAICPIEIYYPEIQLAQVYAPNGWQPQQLDNVAVAFQMPTIGLTMPNVGVKMNVGGMNVNNGMNMQVKSNVGMNNGMNVNMNNNGMNMNNNGMNVTMNTNGMGMNTGMNMNNNMNMNMGMGNGNMQISETVTDTSYNNGMRTTTTENISMNGGGINMNVTENFQQY